MHAYVCLWGTVEDRIKGPRVRRASAEPEASAQRCSSETSEVNHTYLLPSLHLHLSLSLALLSLHRFDSCMLNQPFYLFAHHALDEKYTIDYSDHISLYLSVIYF